MQSYIHMISAEHLGKSQNVKHGQSSDKLSLKHIFIMYLLPQISLSITPKKKKFQS